MQPARIAMGIFVMGLVLCAAPKGALGDERRELPSRREALPTRQPDAAEADDGKEESKRKPIVPEAKPGDAPSERKAVGTPASGGQEKPARKPIAEKGRKKEASERRSLPARRGAATGKDEAARPRKGVPAARGEATAHHRLRLSDGRVLEGAFAGRTTGDQVQFRLKDGSLLAVDMSEIVYAETVTGDAPAGAVLESELPKHLAVGDIVGGGSTAQPSGEYIYHYETWTSGASTGQGQPTFAAERFRQKFLAAGDWLTAVNFDVTGNGSVRLVIGSTDPFESPLVDRDVTVTSVSEWISFDPAIPLSPGAEYYVELSGGVGVHAIDSNDYVFSPLEFREAGEDWQSKPGHDLFMWVSGRRSTPLPDERPSKRALLTLLENDGLSSSLAAIGTEVPPGATVPFLAYPAGADEDDQVRFMMKKNESISQALARLSDRIEALAVEDDNWVLQAHEAACNLLPTTGTETYMGTCTAFGVSGPCPKTRTINPRQNCLDDPPEGAALAAEMMNPAKWEIDSVAFVDWLDTATDYVIEEIAKTATNVSAFSGKYDTVVVLEDAQVKPAIAMAKIEELSANHVVDVHVLTHGSTNKIVGVHQNGTSHDFTMATFFKPLMQTKLQGTPVWLRSVYQMNCNSGTLNEEWRAVGAEGVAGTKLGDVSNYLPQQYVPFVNYWLGEETFADATALAYDNAVDVSADFYSVISQEPDLMEHSELAVDGSGEIEVSD